MFQFYLSSIKSRKHPYVVFSQFSFNSTLVQLKGEGKKKIVKKNSFNSTLVQLKEISGVRIKLHLLRFNSTLVQLKDASEALNSLLI